MEIRFPGQSWHHACLECQAMWEPFKAEDLLDPEEEFSSFRVPCDNCAFRGGSPERADKTKWERLVSQFETGHTVFVCHKGVPLSRKEGESHDHPKNADGAWDMDRMRYCRGFLNMEQGAQDKALKTVRILSLSCPRISIKPLAQPD